MPNYESSPEYRANKLRFARELEDGHGNVVTDLSTLGGKDPTNVLAVGDGGWWTEYDPADYTDAFAAINAVFENLSSDDQATIQLPYTGAAGVEVSESITIPANKQIPTIRGWGADGSVFDYTATDGTPAVDCQDSENGVEYEWESFKIRGPGPSAGGGGHGLFWAGSTNHAVQLNRVMMMDFPGDGIHFDAGFFSGSVEACHSEGNGGSGLYADRMNAGTVRDGIYQGNAGPQIHLEDPVKGNIQDADIDAGAGSSAPAGSIGVLIESVDLRGGANISGCYLEANETHVALRNGGLPVRGTTIRDNRMNSGTTGVHVEDNINASYIGENWFEAVGAQDILLDGSGAILGPNTHISSTAKVTDNTAGSYSSVSQTSGAYPW